MARITLSGEYVIINATTRQVQVQNKPTNMS